MRTTSRTRSTPGTAADASGRAMFRDDAQAASAIRLLLARLAIDGLWSEKGPTLDALRLRDERDAPLSADKRTLLLAAWTLWSPAAPGVALGDVLHVLDPGSRLGLCSLIAAHSSGPDAVDAWIEARGAPVRTPAAPEAPAAVVEVLRAPPTTEEAPAPPPPPPLWADWPTLDVLSVRYAGRVLSHVNGNKSRAAQVLGVDRRTVNRLDAAARPRTKE